MYNNNKLNRKYFNLRTEIGNLFRMASYIILNVKIHRAQLE